MEFIELEKVNSFLILKINNINKKNILTRELLVEFQKLLNDIENDDNVFGIIITGKEECFSAGADIKIISDEKKSIEYLKLGRDVFDKILNFKKITIAAVNGIAYGGGCELALSCDIICASKKAIFSLPEVKLGLFPGWGGTQLATLRLGFGIAKELILTGRSVDAEEAYEITLVDKFFETNKALINGSLTLLNDIFKNSPDAIYKVKQIINYRFKDSIYDGIRKEFDELSNWLSMPHAKEGISAFLEKRKPAWRKSN